MGYHRWNSKAMAAAVRAVLARRCGLREASRRWNVPYTTLREHVIKQVVARSVRGESRATAFVLGAVSGSLPQVLDRMNKQQKRAAAAAARSESTSVVQSAPVAAPVQKGASSSESPSRAAIMRAVARMIEDPRTPFKRIEEVRNAWLGGTLPANAFPEAVRRGAPIWWGRWGQWIGR